MSTTFVHSIKVPRLYKDSAKTVKKVLCDGGSLKTLVFSNKHPNVQGIYALVYETLRRNKELQIIIDTSKILLENPRFDPYLARILITELLWGKKDLKSEAKPVQIVLNYKEKLQQASLQNPNAAVDPCDRNKVKSPRYVRVNTLLTTVEEALDAFFEDEWNLLPCCKSYSDHLETVANLRDFNFIQDFHIPEVLIFPPGTLFHNHPGYLNGKLLLQDKASCLPAFLLNPKPNSEIMDMCSAPGMKTTHLAAIINNIGKIYAVEMNENRYKTLCDFITRTDAKSVESINADALELSPEQYSKVKYILVDPSCSGSGMKRIEIIKQDQGYLHGRLMKLQSLQSIILGHALEFPNVKKVVYSTCSIYPEENEHVVNEALRRYGHMFTLVDLKKKFQDGWHNFGSVEHSLDGEKCLYAIPEKDLCNGFFVAVFKRKKNSFSNCEMNSQEINNSQGQNELNYNDTVKEGKNDENSFVSSEKSEHKIDQCEDSVGVPEEPEEYDESTKSKKSKKKKKYKDDDKNTGNVNEEIKVEVADNEEIPKKKSKKHKIQLNDDPIETHGLQGNNTTEHASVNKKLKKQTLETEVAMDTEDTIPKKSKKKKKLKTSDIES